MMILFYLTNISQRRGNTWGHVASASSCVCYIRLQKDSGANDMLLATLVILGSNHSAVS